MSRAPSELDLQILWNRLVSVVEEEAQVLIRTAFSNTVREAGDLSVGIFDTDGAMLVQAVTGSPGHVNSMANAVRHFVRKYPIAQMQDGDHYITNDPWIASGHLHDFTTVTPAFHRGRCVGLIANTCHVVDVGGRGFGPDARQVFEEGIFIPVLRVALGGVIDPVFLEILRANTREPVQVEGDIHSFIASNEEGCRRLSAMLEEFDLDDFGTVGQVIIARSDAATRRRIAEWPRGTWRNSIRMDGYDTPIEIVATLTIEADRMVVDFAGTSPASRHGINVVLNYTEAYTCFGLKCIVAPEIPNNHGSMRPFEVVAPEGSIVNVPKPWPVCARHVIGHILPDLVMGCLHQARPDLLPAENSAVNWQPQMRGGATAIDADGGGPAFDVVAFHSGGTGGRPGKDGMSATAFPSGVRTMAVETTEQIAPLLYRTKEYRTDSGGPGRWRGGFGQVIEIESSLGLPFAVLAMFDRVTYPARGRDGGADGAPGVVALSSGGRLRPKGQQTIPAGDRLRLELPGGGGLGVPTARDPAQVLADVRDGLVSREAALRVYRVVIDDAERIDESATRALRAGPAG